VTGSTLYRRLADGTWASQREDPPAPEGREKPQKALTPPTPARQRRPLRTIRRVATFALLGYLAWIIGLAAYIAFSLVKVEALSPNPIPDTAGTIWLMVGSDSRAGLTAKERKELKTGNEDGQRTDTIMLVHLQAGRSPKMVSIPRDSWVTIPAHTRRSGTRVGAQQAKINAAYAFGGAPLLTETIEYNTGLRVDHYMEVGMGGIVSMTNAVGGVEVCFERAIKDKNSGLDVQPGCQILDGRGALAWVRMRYADPTGDLGRMQRQQEWIRLVMNEILSWQTLLNPIEQWNIANAVLDAIQIDNDTNTINLGRFGMGMSKIAGGNAEITTVPARNNDHWQNGQWVIKWDTAQSDRLFNSMGGRTPQAPRETP
jgi:LCP family protein required for cell wall assembly